MLLSTWHFRAPQGLTQPLGGIQRMIDIDPRQQEHEFIPAKTPENIRLP